MARGSEPNRKRQAHDARSEKILAAVRTVCVQDGLSRLSVSAVAKHAGCTRSLFYHYFPTKEDAFDALIDESIDTFVEQLVEWNAQRIAGDIEGSLDSAAELLKRLILKRDDEFSQSLFSGSNSALYASFVHRVADRTARYICESTVVDFASSHEVRIDHLYETFYVLITGLIMYVRTHPDVDTETIKDITASTLHIEGYTKKYPDRRPER